MQLRIRHEFWTSPVGLGLLGVLGGVLLISAATWTYYWVSYGRMIDERLAGHVNQTTARIYSAPQHIFNGETLAASDLVDDLKRSGYSEKKVDSAPGWYSTGKDSVDIHPLRESYFGGKNALRVQFAGGHISKLRLLDNGSTPDSAEIEPQLVSNLFDSSREKRRKVRFEDIPKSLVSALLAAEDKRFFDHPGFDVVRILGAAWADLRRESKAQGASTLTMQVSRSLFFSTERTWRRKVAETMVSLQLEHRYNKAQIFELYANEIYLGNRGSFAIHGFGEGALTYFNKDLREITLGQAAFLAGIIRAPNRYSSAEQKPERAIEARDRVLAQMVENRFITSEQARDAKREPLHLVPGGSDNSSAPYFVDMVKDHLLDRFTEADLLSQSYRVYTTLDPDLERAASEAVAVGIANVDQQLARRNRSRKQGKQAAPAQAQVAMVVLDPRTGEIRAVVGGRDYGQSQLNRVQARRQPGSVFKPFVYAAAFDNAVRGISPVITPATTVVDEPTTFDFEGKDYTPNNYGENFHGTVTVRDALTFSLNVATVKVAEMVGYDRVVEMARRLGLDRDILATPSVALGAYEMTPLEVAGGYTVFANGGVRSDPSFIARVDSADGGTLERSPVQSRQVLDPRVAYQVTSLMKDVVNRGTGAGVRTRGFMGLAAGKTGTSRDGWFAGFTSNLLCIVWVGFDDNRELGLSGAASAAPIWAEFMKRATALPAYSDLQDFPMPDGLTAVDIDPETLELATPACPITRREVFITGTEPTEFCERHGGRMLTQTPPISWLSHLLGGGEKAPEHSESSEAPTAESAPPTASAGRSVPPRSNSRSASPKPAPAVGETAGEENKGFFGRFFGIFGGKSNQEAARKKDGN